MTGYVLALLIRIAVLIVAIVMIVQARDMFGGMARGLILLALLFIVRAVDDLTGFLDPFGIVVLSSSVAVVFLIDVYNIWRDRKDHAEYVNWRKQHAEELRLVKEWKARQEMRAQREQYLESLRHQGGEDLSSWDHQWTIADHARKIDRPRVYKID